MAASVSLTAMSLWVVLTCSSGLAGGQWCPGIHADLGLPLHSP